MPAAEYHWPCSSCGADMSFVPGATELRCAHCGSLQAIPESAPPKRKTALQEIPLEAGLRNDLPRGTVEEVRSTPCPSCGAQIEFQGATHAQRCPFCDTALVASSGAQRQIKPQALLPFVLSESQARDAMSKWLGSLWFAPNGLTEYARKGRALAGLYVPYWTFDSDTSSRYTGQRGEYYYETRTVTVQVDGKPQQRQEQVRKIRWYPAAGHVARFFDDVVVLASESLPKRYTDGLQPWDLSKLEPWRADYIAGFTAEGYTVSLTDGHQQARALMSDIIASDIRRDIGGDEQRILSVATDWREETFKHVLLPIWMAAYKYNGKSYRFVVNGQSGKVQGERPYSVWKIAFAVLAAVVVAGLVLAVAEGM